MGDQTLRESTDSELLAMTADIVAAYVGKNVLSIHQLPDLITTTHSALADLLSPARDHTNEPQKPAVPVRRSITPDYLICLEDGKKLKMLKRHLRSTYNMTPEDYRAKWGLPADYPMVAPNYAAQRSEFAKQIGLGRGEIARVSLRKAS